MLKSGEEQQVITLLYDEVMPFIISYIKKNQGDQENAKDIFHDVLIQLILKVRKNELDPDTDVKAYLYTSAKNRWITKAKRDKRIDLLDEIKDWKEEFAETHTPLDESEEKRNAMEAVLERLEKKCRDLLKLTFYMDYSLQDAAEQLGISSAEVAKTNQYRCKKKLMAIIQRDGKFRELMGI